MTQYVKFYNYLFSASTPEELKNQGLKWASNKKAWFFHEYEWTRKNRHSMTMEEIRENHGSEKIKEVKHQRIA